MAQPKSSLDPWVSEPSGRRVAIAGSDRTAKPRYLSPVWGSPQRAQNAFTRRPGGRRPPSQQAKEAIMAKFILNLFGALLFAAALAAAATPALAQDIQPIQANDLPAEAAGRFVLHMRQHAHRWDNRLHQYRRSQGDPLHHRSYWGHVRARVREYRHRGPGATQEFCGAVQVNAGLAVNDSRKFPPMSFSWSTSLGAMGVVIEPHHDRKIYCVDSVRRRERSDPFADARNVRRVQRDYA